MFDHWVASIVSVGAEHSASQQTSRRQALRRLALRRSEGSFGIEAGIDALKEAGHPATIFDELISVDAIEAHASGIAFPHDALADYLLVVEWAAQSEAELISRIAVSTVSAVLFFRFFCSRSPRPWLPSEPCGNA